MKILHVTDLHFRKDWFTWVEAQAKLFDLVCISGDFIDLFLDWKHSPASQAKWVVDWLNRFPSKIAVCSGNHDWWEESPHVKDPMAFGRWLKNGGTSDNESLELDGYLVYCKPWIGGKVPESSKPVILLAHGPRQGSPLAVGIDGDNGDPEFEIITAGLPKDSIVLSGHVHTAQGWYELWEGLHCFNPGTAKKDAGAPNFVIIDTNMRTARLFAEDVKVVKF